MKQANDEPVPKTDEMTTVYCTQCGTALGRVGEPSTCAFFCPRCKTENSLLCREGMVTQQTRKKRRAELQPAH